MKTSDDLIISFLIICVVLIPIMCIFFNHYHTLNTISEVSANLARIIENAPEEKKDELKAELKQFIEARICKE